MTREPTPMPSARVYDATGNSPRAWHAWVETLTQSARRLKQPAAALPDGRELMLATNAVYAMLLGYAIECALKGLWVKEGHKIVADGRYVGVQGVGEHQLGTLARTVCPAVGVAASTREYQVLDRLTAFVLYAGRYPVPRTAEQLAFIKVPGKGKRASTFFSADDFQVAELLLNRFSLFLNPYLPPPPRLDRVG